MKYMRLHFDPQAPLMQPPCLTSMWARDGKEIDIAGVLRDVETSATIGIISKVFVIGCLSGVFAGWLTTFFAGPTAGLAVMGIIAVAVMIKTGRKYQRRMA